MPLSAISTSLSMASHWHPAWQLPDATDRKQKSRREKNCCLFMNRSFEIIIVSGLVKAWLIHGSRKIIALIIYKKSSFFNMPACIKKRNFQVIYTHNLLINFCEALSPSMHYLVSAEFLFCSVITLLYIPKDGTLNWSFKCAFSEPDAHAD